MKIKAKYYFIYTVLLLLTVYILVSCRDSNRKDKSEHSDYTIIKTLNDETNPSRETVSFQNIEIVPLETNENCLISTVRSMYLKDSLIYIHDGSLKLFVFDRKGHFIRQIGSRGQGPEEYLALNSFYIDDSDNSIVIADCMKMAFLYYDLEGRYKKKRDVYLDMINLLDKCISVDNHKVLLNYTIYENPLPGNRDIAYNLLDLDNLKISDKKSYLPIKSLDAGYPIGKHPINKLKKDVHFMMPNNDTIFSVENDKFTVEYMIEHRQKMCPSDKYIISANNEDDPFRLAQRYSKQNLFTGFDGLYETENHILLTYFAFDDGDYKGQSGFLANKKKLEGKYFRLGVIDENSTSIPFFYDVICSDEKSFVSMIDMNNFEYYKELLKDNKNEGIAPLKSVLDYLEEDANPVLIFHTLADDY
ncbi:MAG: 6-bladed beta-propeller [Tannerella sp.]|jgi:hypothetical protein|nr:6-bladed beta-propeller [Tannerella sp.]